ncbi:MAG: pyrroline-5-carboxylate reductase [Sphaerobacter sp.]|nr:pyrroline-5-carboxylate reductase [Sphaerobacter sp.]
MERTGQDILRDARIAFIGCGVMAEAIMSALLRGELVAPRQISGGEPLPARRQELADRYGVRIVADNREAAAEADLVMLTVKPQTLDAVLRDLAGTLRPEQVVVSIIPGATVARLSAGLQHGAIVRAMPNTPAQIGSGVTAWYAAAGVDDRRQELVDAVLRAMGLTVRVDAEDQIDMATALSGSGPAYVFQMMEALVDAGVHLGLHRRTAEQLVYQTMLGSVLFARASGKHPAELRNMVTTPGGTTAAALYQMEKGGLRTVIAQAVWAAYKRAQELGEGRKNGGPELR